MPVTSAPLLRELRSCTEGGMLHLGNTASDIPVLADFGECLDSGVLGMRVLFSHLMSTCV